MSSFTSTALIGSPDVVQAQEDAVMQHFFTINALSTFLTQLRGVLAAASAGGGITGLSHILSSQPYAWPLAVHLSPTETGINTSETYGNVACPTPTCEYYVHALAKGVEATVSIYHPGQEEESGILFCNVAAYDVHGNPLMIDGSGRQYDQLTPLPGETASKTWTGPVLLLARYYKKHQLRAKWVSELNGTDNNTWSLPTITINNNNTQQHQVIPIATVKQQQKFTSHIGPYLERAVVRVAPLERLEPSSTLNFVVNDGNGLFPNPRSFYSHVNPNFGCSSIDGADDPIGIKICMKLPSIETRSHLGLLFGDIMVVDMMSTRTVASVPSDRIINSTTDNVVNGTCWGEAFTIYVLLADAKVSSKIAKALEWNNNTFLLRWDETTAVPGIVYRLVVERDLDEDEETSLKDELMGRKDDDISLEWIENESDRQS